MKRKLRMGMVGGGPTSFIGPVHRKAVGIDGEIEIETSLGEKRSFGAGKILLLEDTEGKGHKTRNLQDIRRRSIFIPLE